MNYRTLTNDELVEIAQNDPRAYTDPLFAELVERFYGGHAVTRDANGDKEYIEVGDILYEGRLPLITDARN